MRGQARAYMIRKAGGLGRDPAARLGGPGLAIRRLAGVVGDLKNFGPGRPWGPGRLQSAKTG